MARNGPRVGNDERQNKEGLHVREKEKGEMMEFDMWIAPCGKNCHVAGMDVSW